VAKYTRAKNRICDARPVGSYSRIEPGSPVCLLPQIVSQLCEAKLISRAIDHFQMFPPINYVNRSLHYLQLRDAAADMILFRKSLPLPFPNYCTVHHSKSINFFFALYWLIITCKLDFFSFLYIFINHIPVGLDSKITPSVRQIINDSKLQSS